MTLGTEKVGKGAGTDDGGLLVGKANGLMKDGCDVCFCSTVVVVEEEATTEKTGTAGAAIVVAAGKGTTIDDVVVAVVAIGSCNENDGAGVLLLLLLAKAVTADEAIGNCCLGSPAVDFVAKELLISTPLSDDAQAPDVKGDSTSSFSANLM